MTTSDSFGSAKGALVTKVAGSERELEEGFNEFSSKEDPEHTFSVRVEGDRIVEYSWNSAETSDRIPSEFVRISIPGGLSGADDIDVGYGCYFCHRHADGSLHCWPVDC